MNRKKEKGKMKQNAKKKNGGGEEKKKIAGLLGRRWRRRCL
jgi:hypothetical protein